MNVDVKVLEEQIKHRRLINRASLKDIHWMKDGKEILVSPELIQEWGFVGLSNIDFFDTILCGYGYLDGNLKEIKIKFNEERK